MHWKLQNKLLPFVSSSRKATRKKFLSLSLLSIATPVIAELWSISKRGGYKMFKWVKDKKRKKPLAI